MKRVFVGIAVAVVLVVVGVGATRRLAPSTRQWPPQLQQGRLVGVIEGTVKRLDQPAGVIDVASGLFGLGSMTLAVGPETTVTVGDRQGGLPNADRGRFVRVTYEVQPGRLLAWRIDVVDGRARASDVVVSHLIAEVATAVAPVAASRTDETASVSPSAVPPRARLLDVSPTRPRPARPPSSPPPPRAIARRPPARGAVASRTPAPAPVVPLPAMAEPPAAPPGDRATEPDLPFPATALPRAESVPPPVPVPARAEPAGPRVDRTPVERNVAIPSVPRPREGSPTRALQLP